MDRGVSKCTTGSQFEHARLVSKAVTDSSDVTRHIKRSGVGLCVMWRNYMRGLTLWPTQEVSKIIQHEIVRLNLETRGLDYLGACLIQLGWKQYLVTYPNATLSEQLLILPHEGGHCSRHHSGRPYDLDEGWN
jgi:hypothetical protein